MIEGVPVRAVSNSHRQPNCVPNHGCAAQQLLLLFLAGSIEWLSAAVGWRIGAERLPALFLLLPRWRSGGRVAAKWCRLQGQGLLVS